MKPVETSLFGEAYERQSRQLPIIGEQKDIRYYASPAKSVLNGPETTGMGFWSINPYIGCAFGCAYCYARYTHRWVMERAADDHKMVEELGDAYNKLPPWLAFERNIFVKKNAPEVLSRLSSSAPPLILISPPNEDSESPAGYWKSSPSIQVCR
jgi:hypothetical protein